jgi:hypothetical protein
VAKKEMETSQLTTRWKKPPRRRNPWTEFPNSGPQERRRSAKISCAHGERGSFSASPNSATGRRRRKYYFPRPNKRKLNQQIKI